MKTLFPSEFLEQKAFINWFKSNYKDLIIFSIPNDGYRHNGNKFVDTGLLKGIPDLEILFPNGKSLFIEMKKRDGKLNVNQKNLIPKIENLGFTVLIGYGFLDAKEKFENYLKENK